MKVLLISGPHPRHIHYANTIIDSGKVVGVIVQEREEFVPTPPEGIAAVDRENFIRHFENRKKCEEKHFDSEAVINHDNILRVTSKTISQKGSVAFVEKLKPDVAFIFGSGMIRDPLFSSLPDLKINMHLGLSPRYRGSATLFWPFYFLEPNWAGSTFHIISSEPDAGDIIHQTLPKLELGDTIHDVACKVVKQSALDVVDILKYLGEGKELKLWKQKGTGKNFLSRDFVPQHLRLIYNQYNDDIVDHYLNGSLKVKEPALIRFTD